MMASTHAAIGVVAYAGVAALTGAGIEPAALGAAAIGAWLPDVDTPHSKAGFCVYPLAAWLEKRFGHRTITHSFLGTAIFAALCAPLLFWPHLHAIYWALLLGYVSHLMADAATKSGVPMAWPNRRPWVFPGNEDFRIRTGSAAEMGVLFCFILLGLLTIPVQRFGVRRLLHMATNSASGAVRDTEDWSEWRVEARVNGYDVLNQRVVDGTWPVVGRRDDGALVIERDGNGGGNLDNVGGKPKQSVTGYWLLRETGTELHRISTRTVRVDKVAPSNSETLAIHVSNLTLAALSRALVKADADLGDAPEQWDRMPPGADANGAKSGFEGSTYLHRVLVSGEGECWPLPTDPQFAPLDVPQFGLKAVKFSEHRIFFDFAQPRHINGAGGRVALRSATLSIKMPKGATLPDLKFPLVRREVVARGMRRHADLRVALGELVGARVSLNRTWGQSLKHELTPEEEDKRRAADAARRELHGLEIEERALKTSAPSTWGTMAASYRERRANLTSAADWSAPMATTSAAPAAATAPFDCIVEAVEWEPPTIPTQKGELPEHIARLTLVQIHK